MFNGVRMVEGMDTTHTEARRRLESKLKKFKIISVALAIAVVILAVYAFYPSILKLISGPPIGQRLTGINAPLSSSELSVINNAPNSYFETSGEMLLNLSLPGEAIRNGSYIGVVYVIKQPQYKPFIVNGKPSVIYVGAISCIYCAENKWAMALALSRFGSFGALYKGYSSLGDGDVPTLYWAPQVIVSNGSVDFMNYYNSSYINFFSAEYDSQIDKGMELPNGGYSFFVQSAQNRSDGLAMEFMNKTSQFQGTPTTFFGTTLNGGADAVVFGQSNSTTKATNFPPLTFMTHTGILNQLKGFDTMFAIEEYAAADVYIAQTCLAINNAAPVCSLPAIESLESLIA